MKTIQNYLFLFFLIGFLSLFSLEKICYAENIPVQENIEQKKNENRLKNNKSSINKSIAENDNFSNTLQTLALNTQEKVIEKNTIKNSLDTQDSKFSNEQSKKQINENNSKKDNSLENVNKQSALQKEEIPAFTWSNYFKAIGIMLLLLVLFGYILKIIKKYGNGRFLPSQKLLPRDSMYLEGQLPLGQGKSIVIVRVLDERLVLGVTEKNINLLTKTGINHAKTFEELMQQAHTQINTNA